MPKLYSRFSALITILCLILFALMSCTPQVTATPETTNTVEATVSATEELIPVVTKNAEELIIFSLEEDGYAHLFAYIPNRLPRTRITAGDWDDITPAPSPDGKRIVFASNRNGFWDLYSLELSTGD